MIEGAARAAGVPFLGVWLCAPSRILEQRIAGRGGDASDATVEVLRSAAASDPGAGAWHAVNSSDGNKASGDVRALADDLMASHIVF
jgi:predicted kinase